MFYDQLYLNTHELQLNKLNIKNVNAIVQLEIVNSTFSFHFTKYDVIQY